MHKLVVPEINAYMRNPLMLLPGKRMKKDQIAFLQIAAGDVLRGVILLFGGPG